MEAILKYLFLIFLPLMTITAVQAKERVIRIPLYSKSISFDPTEMLDQSSLWVGRQINCQLVRQKGRSSTNEAVEQIRYLSSEQIEFTLKENIKFSDGSTLTADDVKYSFEYLKKTHSIQKNVIEWVKEVKILAKFKLVYVLKRPVPQFLRLLGSPNYPIFKKDFLLKAEKESKWWKFPVSCGSYKVTHWDESLKMIRLEPKDKGHPLEFYFQSPNQIDLEQASKYDIISLPIVGGKPPEGYHEERVFDPYQIFIGLNTTLPRWKLRQDRCELFSKIHPNVVLEAYGSLAEPATDLFPRGVLGFNSQSKESPYASGTRKSKQVSENNFCLTFLAVSVPEMYRSSYVRMIQGTGTHVQSKLIDSPVRYASNFLESHCDAIAVGFKANYLDGYEYLVTFLKSDTNFTGYSNPVIAKRIEDSQAITDSQQRALVYRSIAQQLFDECIVYPLITLPEKHLYIRNNLSVPGIGEVALNDYLLELVQ